MPVESTDAISAFDTAAAQKSGSTKSPVSFKAVQDFARFGTGAATDPNATAHGATGSWEEPETGIVAGVKRGLSNLNPIPLVKDIAANLQGTVMSPQPAFATASDANSAMTDTLRHTAEHPIASALSTIPLVGPALGSLAERLPHDPTGAVAEGLTTVGGMMLPGKVLEATKVPRGYAADRLISSLLKPEKASFDLGADPVQATLKSGAWGTTLGDFKASLQTRMARTEAILQRAAEFHKGKTTDVAPIFVSQMAPELKQAVLDGNQTMANRLQRITMNRVADIQDRYGTTRLTPSQVLAENRLLKYEIKFTQDEAQLNINRVKMGLYRGLDSAFDDMIPGAKELNQHYSGLIEADKLVDKRIFDARKSDILPTKNVLELPLAAAAKVAPTLLKTTGAQLLRDRSVPAPTIAPPVPFKQLTGEVAQPPQPPKAETVDVTSTIQPSSGRVYAMPESSITKDARFNRALTTGRKMLPEPGATSVKVTPQPPESFADALAREQTPQSKQIRELAGQGGKGPYDTQARPATAAEYLRTKGGLDMPDSDKLTSAKAQDAQRTKPQTKPTPPAKSKDKR